MFEIAVEAEFSAAHAIRVGSAVEPVHGHNWHVSVVIWGPQLDSDGLLLDFHLVERHLHEIAAGYHNGNLNEARPFKDGINPTAENVARCIADELLRRLAGSLPASASLRSVRVTEAPGCAATYYPPISVEPQPA